MGQAICPGDSAALMPLVELTVLTLPLLIWALAIRGSGGDCTGCDVRTLPGDSRAAGDCGETGDGVNPVFAELFVKTDTRLLSRRAAPAGTTSGWRCPGWLMPG